MATDTETKMAVSESDVLQQALAGIIREEVRRVIQEEMRPIIREAIQTQVRPIIQEEIKPIKERVQRIESIVTDNRARTNQIYDAMERQGYQFSQSR